jgi:hypothetical protein
MIEVLVGVGNDTDHFGVTVRAENIQRAMDIVEAYYPGADARVVHPIEPESFFVPEPAAPAGLVEIKMPESAAG